MQSMDEIMIHIKEESQKYEEKPIEAVIEKKSIIPGLAGRKINIEKSYHAMKNVGYFHENLIEYEPIYPKHRLKENLKYYIIKGNEKKDMISFVFKIDKNTSKENIEELLNIGKVKKVSFTFFLDGYWFEENNDFVSEIARLGHDIGNLSYKEDYQDSSFLWMNTIIKKLTNKKHSYCYMEKEKEVYLDICALHQNYTIKPSKIINENPYLTVKEKVEKGDIVSLKITDPLIKELPSILTYIQKKGIKQVSLTKLLEEER